MDNGKWAEIQYLESPQVWEGFYRANSYWKRFLVVMLCRIFGLLSLIASFYIFNEIINNRVSNDYLFPAIIILLGAITCFVYGEYDYNVYGPISRPIKVFSNGVLLPPIYIQHLKKDKGLIRRFDILSCKILRTEYFSIPNNDNDKFVWRNGPVRMEIHLSNGKVKRTSIKPPAVIMDMAKVIREEWGIPVLDEGEGTGTVERVVNGKVIDSRRI